MNTDHPLAIWISGRTTQAAFAKKVKCSSSHLSLVMKGERGLSLSLAGRIEEATNGEVGMPQLLEAAPTQMGAAR